MPTWSRDHFFKDTNAQARKAYEQSNTIEIELEDIPIRQNVDFDIPDCWEIDADTGDTDKLTAREIFRGFPKISFSHYRCKAYSYLNYHQKNNIYAQASGLSSLSQVSKYPSNTVERNPTKEKLYYGKVKFKNDFCWRPLPSIATEEDLIALKANMPFELSYSAIDNMYYIRAKSNTSSERFIVEYNLQLATNSGLPMKTHDSSIGQKAAKLKGMQLTGDLTTDKQNLQDVFNNEDLTGQEKTSLLNNFFLQFEAGELGFTNGVDQLKIFNNILSKMKGVCRHRSLIFFILAKLWDMDARMVVNDVHAFIEVNVEGSWQTLDLGGGEANELSIIPLNEGHSTTYDLDTRDLDKLLKDAKDSISRFQQETESINTEKYPVSSMFQIHHEFLKKELDMLLDSVKNETTQRKFK